MNSSCPPRSDERGGAGHVPGFLLLGIFTRTLTDIEFFSKSSKTVSMSIGSLGPELLNFVIKYEQGYRQASDLVSKEALRVREVIVQESGKTGKTIQIHFNGTSEKFEQEFEKHVGDASADRLRDKLLMSLKYPDSCQICLVRSSHHDRPQAVALRCDYSESLLLAPRKFAATKHQRHALFIDPSAATFRPDCLALCHGQRKRTRSEGCRDKLVFLWLV